jgi:hypothetical protein
MKNNSYIVVILMMFTLLPFTNAIAQSYTSVTTDTNELLTHTNDTLTLTYNGEHKYYNLEDLLNFDLLTGNGGRLKVTGTISGPYEYTGVLVTTLAQEFPLMTSEYRMVAIADDGYTISYTYDDILGNIMVYDTNGEEIGIGGVSMILATMEDGQTGYPGSYRIAFINQGEPITDSSLWAKYLVELEFIPESSDTTPPTIRIEKPTNAVYFFDKQIIPYSKPFIIGDITITVNAEDESGISRVLFVINEELRHESFFPPYQWVWDETAIGTYTIEVKAYDTAGNVNTAQKEVFILNP